MTPFLAALLQASAEPETMTFMEKVKAFIDTPAPYSPFSEYLAVMFMLWLLARIEQARKDRKKSFESQAQEVLDAKFEQGELSKKAYDKFRQDVSLRPKR